MKPEKARPQNAQNFKLIRNMLGLTKSVSSVRFSIYLSICLSIYLSIYLSTYLSIYLYLNLYLDLYLFIFIIYISLSLSRVHCPRYALVCKHKLQVLSKLGKSVNDIQQYSMTFNDKRMIIVEGSTPLYI